jgi:hypothetical protein
VIGDHGEDNHLHTMSNVFLRGGIHTWSSSAVWHDILIANVTMSGGHLGLSMDMFTAAHNTWCEHDHDRLGTESWSGGCWEATPSHPFITGLGANCQTQQRQIEVMGYADEAAHDTRAGHHGLVCSRGTAVKISKLIEATQWEHELAVCGFLLCVVRCGIRGFLLRCGGRCVVTREPGYPRYLHGIYISCGEQALKPSWCARMWPERV